MKTETLFSSKSDEWETPQWLFNQLNDEFHFNLDACANECNYKVKPYADLEINGLKISWGGAKSVVQSAVQRCALLGAEGVSGVQGSRHDRVYAAAGEDGYKVVSGICAA